MRQECFLEWRGVCTCRHSDAQVSRDQRVRLREGRRFYLGDCYESPIYRGGGLQSRCNGTPGSGGYEIVGSVTAREIIAGTCKVTLELV
jgi:hypothetical protein